MDSKIFWRFENSAADSAGIENEATLYIYGDIAFYDLGWWNWPDDVIPHRFKNELAALGEVHTIHVRINSNGGSVFGAYAIMNLLKSHKAQIITYNDGIAASAATLIAMAGDKIISSLGSVWMLHLPLTTVTGNTAELQKAIEILGTITDSMVDIYHAKTGIDRDAILQMLKDDTWKTGREALEMGLVDEVTDLKVEATISNDKSTAFFNGLKVDVTKFRNQQAFVAMIPAAAQAPQSSPEATPQNIALQNEQEETVMTLAEFKAQHPEIYQAAVSEGSAQATSAETISQAQTEATAAERERIKAIDALILPGMDELAAKAKYETHITAEQFAMEIIKAQKAKGADYLKDVQVDAEASGAVPTAAAPPDDAAEADALLAHLKDVAKV